MMKAYNKPLHVTYSQPPLPMIAYAWFCDKSYIGQAPYTITAAIKYIQAKARKLMEKLT